MVGFHRTFPMTTTLASPSAAALGRDALRAALLSTVDLLKRRRAAEITPGYIDAYVELHWLEWNGGDLRLTVTGQNICQQLTARLG